MTDLTDRLSTTLAGRYRLERELGRGGMATVFLAQDLKHPRRVAIKVLDPELTALLGPERFLREIEISARLQHPHILTLLDSGEARGLLYYVMSYVEGESLRERLAREQQLPVEEALRLAREVADALDYAHGAGVVHRDIKPENILLQAGHAVVADFGIARAVSAAGGPQLTTTGTAVGTPAYMSPEQVMGSRDLDGRSDLYSLGCVLYEMLAGVPPFAGATAESLAHQHLSAPPPMVTSVRPSVPGATARAIARCLAKTPADRFGTAGEFAEALSAPTEVSVPKEPPRAGRGGLIAVAATAATLVLALAVWKVAPSFLRGQPPDPAKKSWILVAAFDGPAGDSLVVKATRELVTAALDQSEIVAAVPDDQIRVALENAGKPTSTRVDAALARELAYRSAVRAVIEGRVTRLGRRYSVALRLVDADSARVLFAVSDVARDEDDLISTVGRIAGKLRAGLGERRGAIEATRERSEGFETPSFEAFRRILRAGELIGSGENRAAITVARSALALDPDYAGAWVTVGVAFSNLSEPDSALEAFTQAHARPGKRSERDRLFDETVVAGLKGDLPGALASGERRIQLDPLSPFAHSTHGVYLAQAGRLAEALESYRTAEKLSPFGPSQLELGNQFFALLILGRIDEARWLAPRLTASRYQASPLQLAMAAGDWEAAESLATVLRSSATHPDVRRIAGQHLAVVQAARGQVQASERTLRQGQSEAEAAEERRWTNRFRWGRLQLALVTQGVAADPGDAGRWDSTTAALVTRGLWSAAAGDTISARRLLAVVRTRSAADLARQGFGPAMLAGWIAARTGRWQEVVRDLGPTALDGDATGYVLIQSPPMLRWLVAEAYERLDRPDSAAAYFERAIASPPVGGSNLNDSRMAFSFGHRRLVLLYARMGRLPEARRHWEVFSSTFTRPDAEMLPLVEEARAALASAERMVKSARR